MVRPFNTLLLFFFITSRLLGKVYYLLYANNNEMPSKVAIDPEKPSLGRIRTDFVPPPHSPASIKRCISRMERTPALAHADIFVDISRDIPLKVTSQSFAPMAQASARIGHLPLFKSPSFKWKTHQSRMGRMSLKIEQRTFIGPRVSRLSVFGSLE